MAPLKSILGRKLFITVFWHSLLPSTYSRTATSDPGGLPPPPSQFLAYQLTLFRPSGGRLWPPHYFSPLPDFQTFLRPCRIVQESVVVETKNLLHHFSVFLADHWSTWVAPVPFSKDWRKRQLVLKSCHLLFILLGANLCLVKLEASLEVSFSKLLFTPHSQKKGPN